ncbi:ATP-binding cassette domain-containing protein [Carboxylicivirga mesophila]|uniref:ATP-binding cassette domain-containing protein n=1 Tax=Carboxylicivirga mesophila TaxID=1166478 RepID=A0ABS5K7R3_9BACT|nr:ATP-binding cassette domain-containing protein [Carboxylicivirga mesophila]MBS2211033.1 ATP-binding cassette domain-containing protein [Carboxylicivirga mesophila]
MSEEILKALIQLFALIAFPRTEIKSRRIIVKSFLNQQLNSRLVEDYLQLFDKLQGEHEQRLSDKDKFYKRHAASSVKVLKIATGINEALTYYQKLIVLIQLIEFLNIDVGMSDYEREFIETVALTFNIPQDEYQSIISFVTSSFNEVPDANNVLIVDSIPRYESTAFKHLFWENLKGELRVIHLKSVNLFAFRFNGNMDLSMNGQLINEGRVQILNPGSSLRNKLIDTIFYSDIFSQFITDSTENAVDFRCVNVEYHFSKKAIGLHKTSFAAKSGKLVGIMGSSGAGKSTLVNVLSGINTPTRGQVLINDIDVHKNLDQAKGLIGYVAQDDLLMEDLTVYQNLYYNAKLCFDNLPEYRIRRKVLKLLRNLGLYEIRFMKVGSPLNKKISGGQRKRLNIALELIREPSILFLDEPTSGLSSRDSDNIIDLLKELSIRGKLVFVVIHQPSSAIFKMFNQLLVLDTGGYLIYNGDPVESVNYFKACINHANRDESECPTCGNVNVEQILNIVNSQILDEYGNFTQTRRVDPKEWYDLFHEGWESIEPPTSANSALPPKSFQIPNRIKQLFIFMKRDIVSKLANKQYLLINLLETPVLALLLATIIRYYDVDNTTDSVYSFAKNPNITVYIIISVIIALFVGLTVSAEEIINDRKIQRRESFLNLSRLSYLFSKLFILSGLSAIQSALFVLIGNFIIELEGMFFQYWLILFSCSVFANILGLNISDTFKKTVNIYIIIPFLIIPQLILSGVFISFDRLNPSISSPERIPLYGEIITARWAFEALAVAQYTSNEFDKDFYSYEKLKSQAKYRKEFWIPSLNNHLRKIINQTNEEHATSHEQITYSLRLINKELGKHHQLYPNRSGQLTLLSNEQSGYNLDSVDNYLQYLKNYYKTLYNKADNRLDDKIKQLTSTEEDRLIYLEAKSKYHNNDLERFVTNSNNFFSNKIIEYDGELWQKIDPIYQDPESLFLKAHFLAPTKPFGQRKIDTYYANTIVIWVINLILFLMLYLRALPGMLSLRTKTIWYLKDRKKAE